MKEKREIMLEEKNKSVRIKTKNKKLQLKIKKKTRKFKKALENDHQKKKNIFEKFDTNQDVF